MISLKVTQTMVSIVGTSGGRPCPGERCSPGQCKARKSAGTLPRFTPLNTFQKGISLRTSGGLALDSKSGIVIERGGVEGQSCFEQDRWIFYETIEKAGFAFEGHSRLI